MKDNLVIVESPAKAKTIEKFLGKNFTVLSSFGHIRDLSKKNLGIQIDNNFTPEYIIPSDKKKIVTELKKHVKDAKTIWLAADEDREGEAIAWHLHEVLKLKSKDTKRIVFHEITKNAILESINNPRDININLVDAQQARRILDRLMGFELSPVLWKKIKPGLSAGRVQSVAVKLIAEREKEIENFKSTSSYKVSGEFNTPKNETITAELQNNLTNEKEVTALLNEAKDATFTVLETTKKPGKKSPSPPFTTSTLQQEASRKLGFSVSKTMTIAQKLYEAGKITYMRTDSVNLSSLAINTAKQEIINKFGDKYSKPRNFATKSKGAQEAHEAIRPTYINNEEVSGSNDEKRLYNLIWKRTIASQMSDASIEKTNIKISNNKNNKLFIAQGEVITFDGFLKVYFESSDDDNGNSSNLNKILPKVNANNELNTIEIIAKQKFTKHPPRYTEASLVRKLEELGIGRPSTYAPTISTIQKRGYVVKETRDGIKIKIKEFILDKKSNEIKTKTTTENTGYEKNKLFPTDIGIVVNDFLSEYFDKIINYNFTAEIENKFDEIASGKLKWTKMIKIFYSDFHDTIEDTLEHSERNNGERLLGVDPKTNKNVYVKIGRFGPVAQLGETSDEDKPRFAGLQKNQHISTITLNEALKLFDLPREIGEYENKKMTVAIGRFGPYIRHDNKFYSLKKDIDNPYTIEKERAIELIEAKRKADKEKIIKIFEEDNNVQILNGRWGPYIKYKKKNFKIPKNIEANKLTLNDCMELINNPPKTKKKK